MAAVESKGVLTQLPSHICLADKSPGGHLQQADSCCKICFGPSRCPTRERAEKTPQTTATCGKAVTLACSPSPPSRRWETTAGTRSSTPGCSFGFPSSDSWGLWPRLASRSRFGYQQSWQHQSFQIQAFQGTPSNLHSLLLCKQCTSAGFSQESCIPAKQTYAAYKTEQPPDIRYTAQVNWLSRSYNTPSVVLTVILAGLDWSSPRNPSQYPLGMAQHVTNRKTRLQRFPGSATNPKGPWL